MIKNTEVKIVKVVKFGGSSVANAEQFKKVATIIESDPDRRIVVVSAPGKRFKNDNKVTDLLIDLAGKLILGETGQPELVAVIKRYEEISIELELAPAILKDIKESFISLIEEHKQDRVRLIDQLKASGEDHNAKLMAGYLQSLGLNALYMSPKDAGIKVSDEPGNAQLLAESYDQIRKLSLRDEILVIPGFFGYTTNGELVTFPRGGSDITGSILAAGVRAKLYENFTDVDSIYSVNPSIVENPQEIEEITYREMRELSYAGFSVFHDEALEPAFRAGIPVCIKNTNNPTARGTYIVSERDQKKQAVIGIASDTGFCSIYVSKYLLNREIGFGRRLLQIFEEERISYEHTPSGIDNMSIILRDHQFENKEVEQRVMDRIQAELNVDDITIERDLAIIMVVGEGMTHKIGIAAHATEAFRRANVNIEMINQGSSEVSMMFGVKEASLTRAVQSLYHVFFNNYDGPDPS